MLLSLWAAICMLIYKLTTWQCRNSSNQFIFKNWTFIKPHTGIRNLVVRIWMCRMVPSILPIGLWEPHTHCMAYTGWDWSTPSSTKTAMLPQNKISVCLISKFGHAEARFLVELIAPIQDVSNFQDIMPQAQITKFWLGGDAWTLPTTDVHARVIIYTTIPT